MSIIGGLDVHRAQITFDWVDRQSGEARRGRIAPATRTALRAWLGQLPGSEGAQPPVDRVQLGIQVVDLAQRDLLQPGTGGLCQ